jgi:hypothetical protein
MAISGLSLRKENFKAEHANPAALYSNIEECFQAEDQHPGTIELLRQVAVHGWAPLQKHNEPRAELLSLRYVAGVVNSVSPVVGLLVDVWNGGAKHGLVAASQHVRLMIGEMLHHRGPTYISREEVTYQSAL